MIFVGGAIICAGLLVFATRERWQGTEAVVETISKPTQTARASDPNQTDANQQATGQQQQLAAVPKTEQPTAAQTAQPPSNPDMPAFDIVRVEEDGMTLVAGTAAPNASVKLQINGSTVAETKADERGDWVVTPDKALNKGAHSLTIVASNSSGEVQSDQMVTVNMPEAGEPLIVLSNPSEPSRILQKPKPAEVAAAEQSRPAAEAQQAAEAQSAQTEGQQAAERQPMTTDEQQTAESEPAAPEQQQTALVQPATTEEQQSSEAAPAAAEEKQTAESGPATTEEQQSSETAPAVAEEQQTAESKSATIEEQQTSETAPAATVEQQTAEVQATTAEEQPAVENRPASTEEPPVAEADPATTQQPQTAQAKPALSEQQQTAETPSTTTDEQRTDTAEAATAEDQLSTGTEAVATERQQATTGEPAQKQQVAAVDTDSDAAAPARSEPAANPVITVPLTLETVDYNDSGDIMFFGRAEPGKAVRIYVDNQHVGDALVDSQGEWMYMGTEQIKAGLHQLRIDLIENDGKVAQRRELPFERADPARVAALQAAQSGTASLSSPQTTNATESGQQEVSKSETMVTKPPASGQESEAGSEQPTVAATTQEQTSVVQQQSSSEASADPAQQPAAEDQQSVGSQTSTAVANSETKSDRTGPAESGTSVQSGAATENRQTGADQASSGQLAVAQPAARQDQPKAGVVVIQPGNSLWRISRVIYGRGIEYTTIYEANKDQIRSPHRIYPGQIFSTPGVLPPREIDPKWRTPLSEMQSETQ